jgi:hypothetical protein
MLILLVVFYQLWPTLKSATETEHDWKIEQPLYKMRTRNQRQEIRGQEPNLPQFAPVPGKRLRNPGVTPGVSESE